MEDKMTWMNLILAALKDKATPLGEWSRYAVAFMLGAVVVWLL